MFEPQIMMIPATMHSRPRYRLSSAIPIPLAVLAPHSFDHHQSHHSSPRALSFRDTLHLPLNYLSHGTRRATRYLLAVLLRKCVHGITAFVECFHRRGTLRLVIVVSRKTSLDSAG